MTISTTTTRQRLSLFGYLDEDTRYEVIGINYDSDFREALLKVKSIRESVKSSFFKTEIIDTSVTITRID